MPKFWRVRLIIVALALMSPVTASSESSFNKSIGGSVHLPCLRFLITNSLSLIGSTLAGFAIGVTAGLKSGLIGTTSLPFLTTTLSIGFSDAGAKKLPIEIFKETRIAIRANVKRIIVEAVKPTEARSG